MPFKANADRRHPVPKQRQKVTNWAVYDPDLRAEARIGRGGQATYSDLAIATALTLRAVFRLALRQTEGLIGFVLRLLDLDLGDRLRSHTDGRRATEAAIAAKMLNHMLKLGRPGYIRIA